MRAAQVYHRVLGIGRRSRIFEQLDPLLGELNSELYLAPNARTGLEMIRSLGSVDLILIEHPLTGTSLRAFLADLRHETRGPVRLAVLVATDAFETLDDPDDPDCIILSLDHPLEELGNLLGALLEHAPQIPVHLMVRLEVGSGSQRVLRLAQTENISKTGMMLRSSEDLPEEGTVGFEFFIPEDAHPISGQASVVRRAENADEEVSGVSLRFEHLLGSDQLRLEHFLMTATS